MKGMKNELLYTIGIDFGTLSARALLVRAKDGKEIAFSEYKYPHKVIYDALPSGKKIPPNWALQHPDDYLTALKECISELLIKSRINKEQITGIGIDFTASTVFPATKDLIPLCKMPQFEDNPHAYVKLWKHHGAQYCADIINQKATEQHMKFLELCGGKVSAEHYYPKLLQIAIEAPEIFENCDLFIEAGDWIVSKITGKLTKSSSMASYKAFWNEQDGYPSEEFLESLKTGFGKKASILTKGEIVPVGTLAGRITKDGAKLTGLCEGTAVSSCIIDAHSSLPALNITDENQMMIIMGTSGCHISLSKEFKKASGILGAAKDGIINGFYGYESGQSGFGDLFEWLEKNFIPKDITEQANAQGIKPLELLSQKAALQKPGKSGLLALDWWNGNRSPLNDSRLSGMIIGLTLSTKPEDIYRALVESIAFGTRKILDNYQQNDMPIESITACGGMSKNEFILQIFADITGKKIKVTDSKNPTTLGSAMFGAVAAGIYDIKTACKKMSSYKEKVFTPIPENTEIYNKLYNEYCILTDYFGKGKNDIMKRLGNL